MQEKYTSNGVIERGYAIYDEWNNKKYSSRKIVNSVQMAVASTNAKKTPSSYIEALSNLFALDLRIKERYNSILKCIIRYFSWRRETSEMKRFLGMLKLPMVSDIRDLIAVELEKIKERLDNDEDDGDDEKAGGGRINEISNEESKSAAGEEIEAVSEKSSEEIRNAEKSDEKGDEIDTDQPTEEQIVEKSEESAEEIHEIAEKPRETSEVAVFVDEAESQQEKLYDDKPENNGSDEQSEPSIDKNKANNSNNGAIDTNFFFEETNREEASSKISFIDEVIMDNIIKGEADIIGHNPLEDVVRNQSDGLQANEALGAENSDVDGKDAHLYDKMVLEAKGEVTTEATNAPKTKEQTVETIPQEKEKVVETIPQEKEPVIINNKPEENRVQIKVEENISEENLFRRSVNDKFSSQMVLLHKSLMEDAMRQEFAIDSDEVDLNNSGNVIEEANAANVLQSENIKSSVIK